MLVSPNVLPTYIDLAIDMRADPGRHFRLQNSIVKIDEV